MRHKVMLWTLHEICLTQKYSQFSICIHVHVSYFCWHGMRNVNWMIPSLPIHLSIHLSIHLFILYFFPSELIWFSLSCTQWQWGISILWSGNTNNQRTELMSSFLARESNFYRVLEPGSIPPSSILMNATWPVNLIEASFQTGCMDMHTSYNIPSDIIFNWYGT